MSSLEDPTTWANYGIAGLALFLMYKLSSGKMEKIVEELKGLRGDIQEYIKERVRHIEH